MTKIKSIRTKFLYIIKYGEKLVNVLNLLGILSRSINNGMEYS